MASSRARRSRHKFVRRYLVSDASVHYSQKFDDVLDTSNTAPDSAYRSEEIEEKLAERGLKSRIHRRAYRNSVRRKRPLIRCARRCAPLSSMYLVIKRTAVGAEIVRTIGIVRARCKIGMTNLVYNIRRFIILEGMAEVVR